MKDNNINTFSVNTLCEDLFTLKKLADLMDEWSEHVFETTNFTEIAYSFQIEEINDKMFRYPEIGSSYYLLEKLRVDSLLKMLDKLISMKNTYKIGEINSILGYTEYRIVMNFSNRTTYVTLIE